MLELVTGKQEDGHKSPFDTAVFTDKEDYQLPDKAESPAYFSKNEQGAKISSPQRQLI